MRRLLPIPHPYIRAMAATPRPMRIRGIVFDMDGTLTETGAICFATMRRRIGCPPGVDIIEHVESADGEAREIMRRVLEEEEEAGLARMALRRGCAELIAGLRSRGIHRGILTRNNDAAMRRTVALLGGEEEDLFAPMLSRAFTPVKPHPAGINHIMQHWGCDASEVIMCGDSVDDMAAGRSAGVTTVLIGEPTCVHYQTALPLADITISCLTQLLPLIEE